MQHYCYILLLFLALVNARTANIFPLKGVNLFAFDSDVLGSPSVFDELAEIKKLGANVVSVNFMIYQDTANSSYVFASNFTPSDEAITSFVKVAHQTGLAVFLKPLIICGDGANCTMVNINPSNVTEWFDSYATYITAFARFAESLQVEVLSFALELAQFSGLYEYEWRNLISSVRLNFRGYLTYCSIMYPVETQRIPFWDALDFISMDTYLPLWNGTGDVPSQEDMNESYTGYLSLVNEWHQNSTKIQKKPIVLSEIGYTSMLYGLVVPYLPPPDECGATGITAPDFTVQSMAFEAAFYGIATSEANIQGMNIFWYDNPSTSDYFPNSTTNNWACGWTIRGKPAAQIISSYWN